jgi:hypothetical protein
LQGQYSEQFLSTLSNLSNNIQAIELASASLNICKKRVSIDRVLGSNTEDSSTYISNPGRDPLGTVDVPALCRGTRPDVYPQQCSVAATKLLICCKADGSDSLWPFRTSEHLKTIVNRFDHKDRKFIHTKVLVFRKATLLPSEV